MLLIAAWLGLISGLAEGAGFMLLQATGGLGRQVVVRSVTVEIVWIAALFNLLLFVAVAVVLSAVRRALPTGPASRTVGLVVFPVMAVENLFVLTLDSHMHLIAVIILGLGVGLTLSRWLRAREAATFRLMRRSLPWVAGAWVVALAAIEGGTWGLERLAVAGLPPARPESPNVLVIVADTLRADHLSGYGYARPTSPHLDAIARRGVLFEQAFSTSPWTAPSHASLLTGLHPSQHGVGLHRPRALAEGHARTLPDVLLARGYRTGAFSANLFWFTTTNGFGRGFLHFEDYFASALDMAIRPIYGRAIEKLVFRRLGFEDIPARRRAVDMNAAVLRWIDADRERPFFAFVNYMDTHDPYLAPVPYRGRFSTSSTPGGLINEHAGRSGLHLTAAQLQGEIDAYDGAIAYLDTHLGKLVEALAHRALARPTLLVVTADHGEALGAHGLLTHASSLFAPELRVPLILAGLPGLPEGARVSRPVSNAAVPATVMDLVGGDADSFPGASLRRLWENPSVGEHWENPMAELERVPWAPDNAPARHGGMKAVITPRWHFIAHDTMGETLFDREHDPGEQVNLAGRPETREVRERLRAHLLGVLGARSAAATR